MSTASDRKSTRLNSSHTVISYAVFCLKKKTRHQPDRPPEDTTGDRRPQQPTPPLAARARIRRLGTGLVRAGDRGLHLAHFFFNDTATTEIYTLSLHDALPI